VSGKRPDLARLERTTRVSPDASRFAVLLSVKAMCVYALEVEDRLEPPPYSDARAEAYARRALMPRRDFAIRLKLPNHRLAEIFNVPLEQVALRRAELSRPDRTAC